MRKERRKRICSSKCRFLNLLIEAQQRIPCSSSPLPLSLSKTKIYNGDCYGVNWVPKTCMNMGIIRQKQIKNCRKTKRLKEKKRTGAHQGVHSRTSPHHGPCVPPQAARGGHCPARSICFSNDTFWLPLDLDLGR